MSDIPFFESKFYKQLEENKKKPEFLESVKRGMDLLKKSNSRKDSNYVQTRLDIWRILFIARSFISDQAGELKNKERKLLALDEYFKIARYSNDGRVWTSGYTINMNDINHYSLFNMVTSKYGTKPRRDKKDVGLKKGQFIQFISNPSNQNEDNASILTEQEKQDIYLTYHDELPWDLEKKCELEEEYVKSLIDTRLNRPEHTSPCGQLFKIKEEDIFVNPNDPLYRYYQICPHCGYIVNIPKEILSDGIKQRIEERCAKDENLFRKMYLYSELFKLDKSSSEGQKRVLR